MEKNIAVVSKDLNDFMSWLDEMKIQGRKFESQLLVKSDDKVYHCIYKTTHTISCVFDSIVETKEARKGDAYSSLLEYSKRCLKKQ